MIAAAEYPDATSLDANAGNAQMRLYEKLTEQKYVAYDALPRDERDIADLLISSGALSVAQNRDGFLYLAKPPGILSFLRGDNGRSSVLHRLATGRVFTGS